MVERRVTLEAFDIFPGFMIGTKESFENLCIACHIQQTCSCKSKQRSHAHPDPLEAVTIAFMGCFHRCRRNGRSE